MALATRSQPAEELSVRREAHRAADIFIDQLIKAGVDTVFGIPGGTIAPLNDALMDRPEVRVVISRHEGGAMFSAAGYARATGKLGVVMVTSGPGALNCMTGIASAFCDSLPILVLAGEVPRNLFGKGALQEGSSSFLNIVGMAKNITKFAVELTDPNSAPAIMRRAMTTAVSGRPGPVLVTLPVDVSSAQVARPGIASKVWVSSAVDDHLLRKVSCTLARAEHPVILAGSGVRWGAGPERLRALAERVQVPVMTTPKAKGVFPESHPLSLGVFGHAGHTSATKYLERRPDVVLAVATGLSDPATNGFSRLIEPTDHFIQIDADASQMGRNYAVSVGLVGPAEFLLGQLARYIPPSPRDAKSFGVTRFTDPRLVQSGDAGLIAPQRALWELQQVLPEETQYSCDIGQHLLFTTHYLEIDDPLGFVIMTGLASMGSGIPAAIGMSLGRPNKRTVAICGDGCFAMATSELATAVQEEIPLIIAVLNDKRYGMVELGNTAVYGRTPEYALSEMRIDDIARGFGAEAIAIERPGEILDIDFEAYANGPLVLDIRIDRSIKMPKSKRFETLQKAQAQ